MDGFSGWMGEKAREAAPFILQLTRIPARASLTLSQADNRDRRECDVAKRQFTDDELEHFVNSYVEYSLYFLPLPSPGEGETWQEGECFGEYFGVDDLTSKSFQKVNGRCRKFLRRAARLLDGNNSEDRDSFGKAGCDLGFTDMG
jgi:hypothetical protein